ncbi:MAG: hypothetical protein ACRD3G_14500 [Vicinamibacterales bacterium]
MMDASPVGALYDSLLQSALRQFFERATFDAEPTASAAIDGRLAIEPSANPSALTIRWFGTRYTLRVPVRWPFTAHEIRLAQAIGAVLAARYRAIQTPRILAERVDLFSGAIEDRYVGAFLDPRSYATDARATRADRIALIIEMLRVAALSSYENRPISTGVLLLGTTADPVQPGVPPTSVVMSYDESLARSKSFFRLAEGVHTLHLASAEGRLLNIIDIRRWASGARHNSLTPRAFQPHARATLQHGHVCAVLSPSREIKIFAEGTEMFTFRGAAWHLVDAQAKYRLWADAVGNEPVAARIFQTARDLSDAREGALFVVVREPDVAVSQLVPTADRLDLPIRELDEREDGSEAPTRRHLLHLLERRTITDLDPSVFMGLAALDGATVTDRSGRLLAAGAILRHPPSQQLDAGAVEDARTTAAMGASQFGPVLKVSEDGVITFFDRERVWDI